MPLLLSKQRFGAVRLQMRHENLELQVRSQPHHRAAGASYRNAAFQAYANGSRINGTWRRAFAEVSKSFSNIERVLSGLTQNTQTKRRTVRISVSGAFATHWFMPRMNEFQELFPDVDIQWQLIIGPLDCPVNDADIAMRFDPKEDDRHRIYPLMPELLLPVRSPASTSIRYRPVRVESGDYALVGRSSDGLICIPLTR